jgi:GT2 family glycosyltransferase
VDEMIGIEHEWLVWDNSRQNLGLSEVYNKLATRAKYPFICFLHEDVVIQTRNWGSILVELCLQQNISLLGVAGGKYKSRMFSGWYSGGKNLDYFSLLHINNGKEQKMEAPEVWEQCEEEVASIDGLFMFCKKTVWETTRFDEGLLKGFHYYDIDFSLRVAQHAKVAVTNRLALIHYTKGGDYGEKWLEQTIVFHKAMKRVLPFSVSKKFEKNIEIIAAKYWLDWLKNMTIGLGNKLKWIQLQKLYLYPSLFYGIAKFLLYRPLKLKTVHYFFKGMFSSK